MSDVVVLVWPDQASEAERLRRNGVPRLLLVAADVNPPADIDHLADWVRIPAGEQEVAARVVALMHRARAVLSDRPSVDQHGRIAYGDHWAALSPIETRLAKLLCDHFTEVVTERELRESAWPAAIGLPNQGALRVHLHRLRHRVADLGLEVVSVRGEGVVLQPSHDPELEAPRPRPRGGQIARRPVPKST